jgi:hypothetical protein
MVAAARFGRFMEEQPKQSQGTNTSAPSSNPKGRRTLPDESVAFKWLVGGGVGACAFLLSIFVGSHISLENRLTTLTKTFHEDMAKQTLVFDAKFDQLNTKLSVLSDNFRAALLAQSNYFHEALLAQSKDLREEFSARSRSSDEKLSAHSDRMHEQMLKMNTAIARLDAKTELTAPAAPRETTRP